MKLLQIILHLKGALGPRNRGGVMEIQGEVLTANYQNSHTADNITMPANPLVWAQIRSCYLCHTENWR